MVSVINAKLRMFSSVPGSSRSLNNPPGHISKGAAHRMIYKNFDDHITRKHGIVIEGWPLRTFENPSSVGSQMELRVLLNAWNTGATRFHKLTDDEHIAWVENRASLEPSSSAAHLPSTSSSSPPEEHGQRDHATATAPPVTVAPFNIVHFESPTTPPTATNIPKKPRKTRSDKGKPRKKAVQIPGGNIFRAGTL